MRVVHENFVYHSLVAEKLQYMINRMENRGYEYVCHSVIDGERKKYYNIIATFREATNV